MLRRTGQAVLRFLSLLSNIRGKGILPDNRRKPSKYERKKMCPTMGHIFYAMERVTLNLASVADQRGKCPAVTASTSFGSTKDTC